MALLNGFPARPAASRNRSLYYCLPCPPAILASVPSHLADPSAHGRMPVIVVLSFPVSWLLVLSPRFSPMVFTPAQSVVFDTRSDPCRFFGGQYSCGVAVQREREGRTVLAPAIPRWPCPWASWDGTGSIPRRLFWGQRPLGLADEEDEGAPPAPAPATLHWLVGRHGRGC